MKYKNRIAALLLCLLLLCTFSMTAYAHEIPDESRKGTITVDMVYDGKAVTGGTLTAYRVGRIQEDDGNYSFTKTASMEDFSGSYGNISDPELTEDVAAFVEEQNVPACATAENEAGKAVFTDLELGVYLIVQTEASDGYEPLNPFLVSVPMNEDGYYVYEVNAEGKFQLYQAPTTPTTPTKPSEPTLPQSGQLNWPIPVLAVLGMMLFSVGWALRFRKKKNDYEK